MKSVAIIGGGITGLTAGFYLQRAGIPVTVYEATAGGQSRESCGGFREAGEERWGINATCLLL